MVQHRLRVKKIQNMKSILKIASTFFVLFLSTALYAQPKLSPIPFKGKVIDAQTKEALPGANVILVSQSDTTRKMGAITDGDGQFVFARVMEGMQMDLVISFVGYTTLKERITLSNLAEEKVFLIVPEVEQLDEIRITAVQTRVEMKGDTAQYNASAFKVNQDASAQDLLTKLPGVVTTNGQLQAQGEQVKRVLVDGQEFFGEDPTLALKSLPADVISQIQIFDRQSDQSQFTGFSDGNTEKTINIITRNGGINGVFGRLYSAYGTDSRYQAGGNVNYFKGNERISLVGLSNNINQQNFSSEDLIGVAAAGSSGGGGGGRGGRPGGGSGANPNDFMLGQSSGINSTSSVGLNYSNNWKNTFKLNGSYFFNMAENNNNQITAREFLLQNGQNQFYDENSISNSDNYNHRLNLRGEYTIDKNNSIIFSPRISYQDNSSNSSLLGDTKLATAQQINQLQNTNKNNTDAISFSNSILWRHRFEKPMRTVSLDFRTSINTRNGDASLYSSNRTFMPRDTSRITDQLSETESNGYTYGLSTNFTEPLAKDVQLMLSYYPQISLSKSDQFTNFPTGVNGPYSNLQPQLSSSFDNTTTTQRGGTGVRWNMNQKANLMVNLEAQMVSLSGEQTYPTTFETDKSFFNVLPFFMFSYNFERTSTLRVFYRTNTQVPSISQLQPVINNTNPLFLSSGNRDLDQQYNQSLFVRYNKTNSQSGTSLFLFANASFSNSYLGNTSVVAARDTVLPNSVILTPGSQFSQPKNLEGYTNIRTFATFSVPSTWLKSTLNMNLGFSYAKTPSVINSIKNSTDSYTSTAGLVVASNVSQNVDFTLNYNANYVTANNAIQPTLNTNYYNGLAGGKVQLLLWESLVIASDINYSHYIGLGDGFNQNFTLWNASIGYKFLKDKQAEIKFSFFDILKANQSINRNITDTYIEDVRTAIIRQYALVTFTYNLRSFTGMVPKAEERRPGQGSGRPRRD